MTVWCHLDTSTPAPKTINGHVRVHGSWTAPRPQAPSDMRSKFLASRKSTQSPFESLNLLDGDDCFNVVSMQRGRRSITIEPDVDAIGVNAASDNRSRSVGKSGAA